MAITQAQYKTALITGASSGIGRQFALSLAQTREWNLILVARDTENLIHVQQTIQALWVTAGPSVTIESVDLAREADRTALMGRLQATAIDLLINNAATGFGISALHRFTASDAKANEHMLNLNCIAPIHLCRLILPAMVARQSGAIINVCSRRALSPTPFLACYAASKTFLLHMSVALREETRGSGIKILAFCPSPTDTPGHRNSTNGLKTLFRPMPAEHAVQAALKALENDAAVCVAGLMNKLVFGIFHRMPFALAARIQSRITNITYPSALQ